MGNVGGNDDIKGLNSNVNVDVNDKCGVGLDNRLLISVMKIEN